MDIRNIALKMLSELKNARDITTQIDIEVLKKEATRVVKVKVEKALSNAGYDTGKPFIKMLIASTNVKVDSKLLWDIDRTIENKNIVTEWQNKGSKKKEKREISSIALADLIDGGRPAFTIKSNQEHGLLAIPPNGEPYDPDNKANTLTKIARVPAMTPARYMAAAEAALDEWVDETQDKIEAMLLKNLDLIVARSFS
jgi:peptidyl-tRNA hydrolase